ncbi:MAG: [FeFe] hydrogenase H-cluster maturation GTPase HydF [Eubacterium sp.]|nr:[FeFe] hydrogenase H-cluster maturation GTPase HydF [Eubacterium sp.]
MSLNQTPRSNRLHIGIFGKTNSGKSSLINAIAGHDVALVSEQAGTTTDPVYKSMELNPIGPVVLIDTAGFDDNTALGKEREARTRDVISKTDVALLIFDDSEDMSDEIAWMNYLDEGKVPVIAIISKNDIKDRTQLRERVKKQFGLDTLMVSAKDKNVAHIIKNAVSEVVPEDFQRQSILRNLIDEQGTALLVMPQDIQAPKGRLILPQVQTIRELLDNHCVTVCTTVNGLEKALGTLKNAPDLIITDSQCFKEVNSMKPAESKLTSFSVLFAAYKGDIDEFIKGASAIDMLTEESKVLIAEACTHAPLEEDIGRVKIPMMLRKKFGENIQIDMVSGSDFPNDLTSYDLIIHCGACMFNRKYMMSRVKQAKEQEVPMTNYGITIAHLTGILNDVVY